MAAIWSKKALSILPPDMLEHADRDDTVIRSDDIAVVGQRKPHPVGQARRLGPLPRQGQLLGGQRYPLDVGAGPGGDGQRHAPPAAADVQHPLPGSEVELGGDVALLGRLRLLQSHVRPLEIGAGILQVLIEEPAIEVERQVVVVRNVAPCGRAGVSGLANLPPPAPHRPGFASGSRPLGVAGAKIQQVADRAALQDQAAVHIGLADAQIGLGHDPGEGQGIGDPGDDRRLAAVAQVETPAARQDHGEGACPEQASQERLDATGSDRHAVASRFRRFDVDDFSPRGLTRKSGLPIYLLALDGWGC